MTIPLLKDPYNIVITGVGGQGNVMASRGWPICWFWGI